MARKNDKKKIKINGKKLGIICGGAAVVVIALVVILVNVCSLKLSFAESKYEIISTDENVITAECNKDVEIHYASSDEEIFTVDDEGAITIVDNGEAEIIATVEGKDKEARATVVTEVAAESIVIQGDAEMTVGDSQELSVVIAPENALDQDYTLSIDDEEIATLEDLTLTANKEGTVTVTATSEKYEITGTLEITISDKPAPSSSASTATSVTYIRGIPIANKTYALPANYNPGVQPEAQNAFNNMQAAAKAEGIDLWIVSGFRSYDYQSQLYWGYVAQDGQAAADTYSARPGHSEHQLGLAFDLNSLDQSFGQTREGQWLANNCYKYGFIIRYPQSKESITGYKYEPWHVRYIGIDMATDVYNSGLCLEEYLGITSVYAN